MRLIERLAPQSYEQRLRETRQERKAETKQVEPLSAALAMKASFAIAQVTASRPLDFLPFRTGVKITASQEWISDCESETVLNS
jgi:hypothetical protein